MSIFYNWGQKMCGIIEFTVEKSENKRKKSKDYRINMHCAPGGLNLYQELDRKLYPPYVNTKFLNKWSIPHHITIKEAAHC